MSKLKIAAICAGVIIAGTACFQGYKAHKEYQWAHTVIKTEEFGEPAEVTREESCTYRGYCYGYKMSGSNGSNYGYRHGSCRGKHTVRRVEQTLLQTLRNGEVRQRTQTLEREVLSQCE